MGYVGPPETHRGKGRVISHASPALEASGPPGAWLPPSRTSGAGGSSWEAGRWAAGPPERHRPFKRQPDAIPRVDRHAAEFERQARERAELACERLRTLTTSPAIPRRNSCPGIRPRDSTTSSQAEAPTHAPVGSRGATP